MFQPLPNPQLFRSNMSQVSFKKSVAHEKQRARLLSQGGYFASLCASGSMTRNNTHSALDLISMNVETGSSYSPVL